MVNSEAFVERLESVMGYYGLSASGFADKIGVQRSSISHLLSGRNKPSLDFVMKVVRNFPEVNLYWILNGKGEFPPEKKSGEIKGPPPPVPKKTPELAEKAAATSNEGKSIDRVIIFYSDGSFEAYGK